MARPRSAILRKLAAAWLACLVPGAPGCRADAPAPAAARAPRLVLVYVPCTVNRGFLSPYEASVDFTPRLARFARDARVFSRHVSEAGHSGTAYASIFSGTQAPEHGVFVHPSRLADSVPTLAELFAAHGYETFYWAGQSMASPRYGYARGVPDANVFPRGLRARQPEFARILERLRREPDYRAFVLTGFTVTHSIYKRVNLYRFCREYPARCALPGLDATGQERLIQLYVEHATALQSDFPHEIRRLGLSDADVADLARVVELLYASNVNRLDRLFGEVVAAIGASDLLDESLIAFTADHGERLYREKGLFKWSHGWELAPEVLTVPLLIRAPGAGVAPGLYPGVSRSVDLLPTLASLAGIAVPAATDDELRGVDLAGALRGGAAPPLRAWSHTVAATGRGAREIAELPHWARYHSAVDGGDLWVSLREGDWMFEYRNRGDGDWGFAAFDLAADAYAESDRFDAGDPRHQAMARDLLAYRERLRASWVGGPPQPIQDDAGLGALRELGYVR